MARKVSRGQVVSAEISSFDPLPRSLAVEARNDLVNFRLDRNTVPIVSRPPYHSVVLSGDDCRLYRPRSASDLAAVLGVDDHTFSKIAAEIPDRVGGEIARAGFAENQFVFQLRSTRGMHRLSDLYPWPGTKILLILTEIAVAVAQVHAEQQPTLLLIDGMLGRACDLRRLKRVFDVLASNRNTFQTIMATSDVPLPNIEPEWAVARIDRRMGRRHPAVI